MSAGTLKSTGLRPATREAMDLLMRGAQAFARMSHVGIRIDTDYLDRAIAQVKKSVAALMKELKATKEYAAWARHFGPGMKLTAYEQLGTVVFKLMGHPRDPHKTDPKTGRPSNKAEAFEHLDLPFTKTFFQIQRLTNALGANKRGLLGIRREVVDGRVHPFFNLHTAESYRSSSSAPNFHNLQVRDKAVSQIVRSCVVPTEGWTLLEADYNVQEVRVSCCYHQDPRLIEYVTTGIDMHKDRALELYMLTEEELGPTDAGPGKDIRYNAKNKYTFPQFYGSTYVNCAPALWDAISKMRLTTAQGVPLRQHLESRGVTHLGRCSYDFDPEDGSFEKHVAECDRIMWQEVFTVYDQWKRDWWALYQRQGGVNTLTGFRQEGHFRRNQILCDPIQGSAFHCELDTLIHVQEEFRKRRMKARVINQIHDSILTECPKSEVAHAIEVFEEVGVVGIARRWPWLVVPLKLEYEASDTNWFQKKKVA